MGYTRIRQKRNELLISSPLVKSPLERTAGIFAKLIFAESDSIPLAESENIPFVKS